MNTFEREQEILRLLHQDGQVFVKELSKLFRTSEVTIRSDLSNMEAKGLLSRIHGGAIGAHKTYYNMDLQERINTNQEAKKKIAKRVAEMISDNSIIMFNAGTTSLAVFRMLPLKFHLSIITNSIPLSLEAGANPSFNVVLVGGQINYKYQFTYGDDARNQLKKYRADYLILSVDGISAYSGLTSDFNYEAGVNRTMLDLAGEKIAVADSSKIGRNAFAKTAEFQELDYVFTNECPEKAEELAAIRHNAPNVILVP